MSFFKKKNLWLLTALSLAVSAIVLTLSFLLGSFFVLQEWLPQNGMNIIIKIAVIISVFCGGKTIYGAWKSKTLLCYTISAAVLSGCLVLIGLTAGEGSGDPLVLLENLICAFAAALFGAFVQIRHNNRKKKRLRKR